MSKAAAILLAAGLSRRMGARNKLLLPVNGTSLVRHVVDTYAASIDGPVLVVLGHQAEAVAATLDGACAETVVNPQYADGQFTSVATGLQHADCAEVVLIGLCDQPLLTKKDITTMLNAHSAAETGKISVPVRGPERGNPIVVPHSLRVRMLEDRKTPGCRKFIRAHPEWVQDLALPAEGYFFDIDTPDAYEAFLRKTRETVQ
ncbi:MAG: nucleotidyltransferase family protein [Pseudomonadota bacterium]